jgi:hypothetical protein
MTELLIRDQIELERQRDAYARLDRINNVEKSVAILTTRYDASMEHAVTQDMLKTLKREVDDQMRQTFGSINEAIVSANSQQARDILAQVELMNARGAEQQTREAQGLRRSIMLALLGTVFSVVGSILFLIMTGQR